MEPTDLTLNVLLEIRDSIRETNSRVDQTNARLDQTNIRLDQTNIRLEAVEHGVEAVEHGVEGVTKRLVESEIRLGTAIAALGGTLEDVKTLLKDRLDLRDRVERCEVDIGVLKHHAGLR